MADHLVAHEQLQRKLTLPARDFASIPVFPPTQASKPWVQAKRVMSAAHDPLEREADAMADRVVRAQPRMNLLPGAPSVAPPTTHDAQGSAGAPLDASTRQFMESGFGHDFSRVRVHASATAAESARQINARAYTVGHDIVFGHGQYNPDTSAGRHLLAHELAHTVQQEQLGVGMVQRAEVDDSASWCPIFDVEDAVNAEVNRLLDVARKAVPGYAQAEKRQEFLLAAIAELRVMESWAYSLFWANKPSGQSGTKYDGTTEPGSLAAVIRIGDLCIGNDKLGHFFEDGWNAANADDDATAYLRSVDDEIDSQGLAATGVFSNADIVANLAGRTFWQGLRKDPDKQFKIADFITRRWNEVNNASYYTEEVGEVVWQHLLEGNWTGTIVFPGGNTGSLDVQFTSASGLAVAGRYSESSHGDESDPWHQTLQKSGEFTGTIVLHSMELKGASQTADAVYGINILMELTMHQGPNRIVELVSEGERMLIGKWSEDDSGDANEGGSWTLRK